VFAGCSPGTDVAVGFVGQTPTNALVADTRGVEFRCPGCKAKLDVSAGPAQRCPDRKNCGIRISWARPDRACGYCFGTGECVACRLMNQDDGKCYSCRGQGYVTVEGTTPDCKNCKRTAKCPICKGERRCDFCGGDGKVSLEELRAKAKPEPAPNP